MHSNPDIKFVRVFIFVHRVSFKWCTQFHLVTMKYFLIVDFIHFSLRQTNYLNMKYSNKINYPFLYIWEISENNLYNCFMINWLRTIDDIVCIQSQHWRIKLHFSIIFFHLLYYREMKIIFNLIWIANSLEFYPYWQNNESMYRSMILIYDT